MIAALLMTSAAASTGEGLRPLQVTPTALAGQAPCHPGKHNGFRLYCHVAVKFKLDARKFFFVGGSCGHGLGEWGFSAGPGAVTRPAKGWSLTVHFGTQDYGKAVNSDGKYGRKNGYDEINVTISFKQGVFVPPESQLSVIDRAATVSLSSGMTRGSYRARVAWVNTAKPRVLVGTFHCW
jgi:hypothetical protein